MGARSLHIAFLGCGNMGSAIFQAFTKNLARSTRYTLITPHKEKVASFLNNTFVEWLPAGEPLSSEPDILLIAVKPQQLEVAFPPYSNYTNTIYLSIVAGKEIASYERLGLNNKKMVRLMPNLPAQVGKGMTALFSGYNQDKVEQDLVTALATCFGKTLWLEDEAQFHPLTALSGSGPAYVFLLVEALIQAGIDQGFSQDIAETLARETVVGAGAFLGQSLEHPARLREMVTSPGGTTEAALAVLKKGPQKICSPLFQKRLIKRPSALKNWEAKVLFTY